MPVTSCKAKMRFVDVTALSDSSFSVTNDWKYSEELFEEEDCAEQLSYGTLEHNQFALDKTRTIQTGTESDIAYWSNKSNEDCVYEDDTSVTINFTKNHTSAGITLYFKDDYPGEITVSWYTLAGTELKTKTCYPDKLNYVVYDQVENYGKIKVTFVKSRLPKQYVKLQYVLFGLFLDWDSEMLQSATIHEEIDETSETLSINTGSLSIVDEQCAFDIENKDGIWRSVQKTQKIWLYETLDGIEIDMGTFYVDEKTFANNIATFSLIDQIGLMDNYNFYEGRMYENVKAGEIMDEIFAAADMDDYTIEDEIYNIELTGYLAIMTCREALHMVCFATGSVADTSRLDHIRIYKPSQSIKSHIGLTRKFNGMTSVALEEYVSGISIECSNYTENTEKLSKIYNDTLPAGDNRIEFKTPYNPDSLTVTGGTLKTARTNYCVVTMEEEGTCYIAGYKYEDSQFCFTANEEYLSAGEPENIHEVTGITLYNATVMLQKATDLLQYYALRKKVSLQYLMNNEKVSDWVTIDNYMGYMSISLIESQDINLAGGYIATASCRGYSKVVTWDYYTGEELFTGEEGLI